MDEYVLVEYELQGKRGKIIVKDGMPEEKIKEYCAFDRYEKEEEKLIERVKIIRDRKEKDGRIHRE